MQPERHPGLDLPTPDEASAAHCRRVCEHIARIIEECGGSISFAEFMQQALYAPGLGYYVSGTTKFGADGDFVTAPETSPLFGKVLATQIASVLDQMNGGDGFELVTGRAFCRLRRCNQPNDSGYHLALDHERFGGVDSVERRDDGSLEPRLVS